MFWETLGIARDGAIILLALEAILLALVPLFIFYQTARLMHKLVPKVVPAMRRVHQGLLKGTGIIERVMAGIRAPFIWVARSSAALHATTISLRRSLNKGRRQHEG